MSGLILVWLAFASIGSPGFLLIVIAFMMGFWYGMTTP
jgi:hypothetical protein